MTTATARDSLSEARKRGKPSDADTCATQYTHRLRYHSRGRQRIVNKNKNTTLANPDNEY